MRWGELLDILELRARHLNLGVDAIELELALYNQLMATTDLYLLSAFMVRSDALFRTSTGVERYPMPEDFGRLLPQQAPFRSGIKLFDGTSEHELTYKEPIDFFELDRSTTGRPGYFTLMDRAWWLNPPPDANGGTPYIGRGLYVRRIDRIELDDDVPLGQPSVLITSALWQIAADKGLPQAASLAQERLQALSALVNDEARRQQQFWRPVYTPVRRHRR